MTIKEQFFSGLRWVATGRLAGQVISWFGTIYVMRILVPHDYGLAAICATVIAFVTIVADFGLSASVVQAKTLNQKQVRSILGASIVFSMTAAIAIVLIAPLLAWFFKAPDATALIRVSALHMVLAPFGAMSSAFLRRNLRFKVTSLIEFTVVVAASLTTVSLAYFGTGVWAIVLGPLAGSILGVLMLNIAAPQLVMPSFNFRPAQSFIEFGFKVAISRLANFVFGQSDFLIAGRALSSTALGEYSVAMQLAMLPVSRAMGIVNQVTYPTISRMDHSTTIIRPILLQGLRLFGYVIIPMLWGLAAVAHWLVPALIGPNWVSAVQPLQVVCLALPLRLMSVLLSSVLQGMGHAGLELRNTITGVILMPICFLIGVQFGPIGLATSWLFGLPILVSLNLYRASPFIGFGMLEALRALSKPIFLSAAMGCSVLLIGYWAESLVGPFALIGLLVAIGTLFYVGMLWFVDQSSAQKLLEILYGRTRE